MPIGPYESCTSCESRRKRSITNCDGRRVMNMNASKWIGKQCFTDQLVHGDHEPSNRPNCSSTVSHSNTLTGGALHAICAINGKAASTRRAPHERPRQLI